MNTALKVLLGVSTLAVCLYATSPQHEEEVRKQNELKTQSTSSILNPIANQVALDAEQQYEIIKRNNGSQIDLGVRASLVAEAYLQAHDELNYKKWKTISESHDKH